MNKFLTLMLAAFLFVSGQTFAQTPAAAPQKITSVEGITEYKMSNGLRVLLFPDQSQSTITVNITYLVGSRMEGYGETGMAHLLEHMVFKGSTNHTNIPQELTSHGSSPNGSTWYDRTNYFETFNASEDNLNWALSLESDRMVNSFIKKEDLMSEFSVVRSEFEMGENDPGGVLMERIYSTAYLWHNYGKSTIGSKEDIEKVPVDNLKAFYKKYYQPDNAVLLVAGKIDEQKVLGLVVKYFGSIPRPARVLQEPYTIEPAQDGERSVTLRRTGDVQVIAAGYHICAGSHPDYAATDVLQGILTDEPSGRLYKALVETKKATSVSGFSLPSKDPGYAYYSAEVPKDKSLDDAKNTMMTLFDELTKNPVKDEETQRAKDKILKYYNMMYNNSTYIGTYLSEYIAQGDWRLMFLYRDQIEKVTSADVNRIAATYYKPSNRTAGVFIPDANPDRVTVPAAPSLAVTFQNYKGKEIGQTGEAFDATPANIDAKTVRGQIPGGAKYSLLPKSTRGGVVKARITLQVGSEPSLKNKATTMEMTASMLDRGSKNKTREQISDELAKLKSEININSDGQKIIVSLESTKENLKPALEILKEILREPVFPSNEFDKLKQEMLTDIDAQKSEPQALAFNVFGRLSNNYDASDFRYIGTYEEQASLVNKVSVDDVKKFYNDFYNSQNAIVVFVGDFDKQVVVDEMTSALQNWSSNEKFAYAQNKYYDAPAKLEKINTPDKANATLAAGMNLDLKDDNADYPSLIMGNFVLGGGFLNSRLSTRIRQKEGLSYGVSSWLVAGERDSEGNFGSYAIYNPENGEKVMSAYHEEVDRLLKDGITAEELKDAKSGFLQSRERNRSSDEYLLDRLTRWTIIDRTFKWDSEMETKINGLTTEQINASMRKWLKPDKLIFVQAGDFKKP
jgi:zinc protease